MDKSQDNPLQELFNLRDRMNRLFEESMGRFSAVGEGTPVGHWRPPADIHEEAERLVIRVELPGMTREDIDVTVEDGSLILRGERKLDPGLRPEDFHRLERSYGPFLRSFRLPPQINHEAIQAEMHDGILVVSIPRAAGGGGSKVRVQVT